MARADAADALNRTPEGPAMNIKLLRQIQAAILAEPDKFDMGNWFCPDAASPCGTSACIAGYAITLGLKAATPREGYVAWWTSTAHESYSESACKFLRLDYDKHRDILFFADNWPQPFKKRYFRARRRSTRARVAAGRIDHFIATKGRE